MITNFEEITENLSEKELKQLDNMKTIMLTMMKKDEFYKAPILVSAINYELAGYYKINSVSLRKWTNYFRTHSIIPIVATSNGYCLTDNVELIRSQIRSLNERASSIRKSAQGMEQFLLNKS